MFTGIIESTGKISRLRAAAAEGGAGLEVALRARFRSLRAGDSVAVEGVCLTVLEARPAKGGREVLFAVGAETLRKSTLGGLKLKDEVNLELPLKVGGRLGGHFVLGHVDGLGEILKQAPEGNSKRYEFSFPAELRPYLAPKGSVAVNGISLTIAELKPESFTVSVLDFTEQKTSLKHRRVGEHVNLEADILAKIVARQVEEVTKQAGFMDQIYHKRIVEWDELTRGTDL